ncbi:NUDIX hydrolase [Lignipirellula cremea]|uniref:GDP-mannose pyrophosphatase n=1 Tax=Lignipirellula cremea TaxID=2528010 RepID=A0A518E574_9BACT|nr:NUDIX hydrolase [Lignipirellula cremea]QDU99246.1 ADP-ribose pyrophosphatase [Lignipirellula cremea]
MTDEILFRSSRFHVARVNYSDGEETLVKEVVRHPGAAAILPLLPHDRVCLIRNYRPTAGDYLLEIPAGTREAGEPPADTAARELTEETGYQAGKLEKLHEFYVSPGVLDEVIILYAATDLVQGDPHRESGELIENQIVHWEDALAMVDDGRIHDAKTIIALLYYDRLKRRL